MCRTNSPMIGRTSVSFSAIPSKPIHATTKPQTSQSSRIAAIEDICAAITVSAARVDAERCLGYLPDDGDIVHRHELFIVDCPRLVMARRSLHELLRIPKQRGPGQGMSWKDSLSVAVTLASSIIQLDGTGWLKQQWDSEDVVFLTQDYAHPYLCWEIQPACARTDGNGTPSPTPQIRCRALASLGGTLVE